MTGTDEYTYAGHTGTDINLPRYKHEDYLQVALSDPDGFPTVIAAQSGEVVEFNFEDRGGCLWKEGKEYQFDNATDSLGTICGGRCKDKKCAGNYVIIDHDPDGSRDLLDNCGYRYTAYYHLQQEYPAPFVKGQPISMGDRIGDVGSSGESSQPHLHFEVWNKRLNPAELHSTPPTENNDGTRKTSGDLNPDYLNGVVDPFYSWVVSDGNPAPGHSLWQDQCSLPIYSRRFFHVSDYAYPGLLRDGFGILPQTAAERQIACPPF